MNQRAARLEFERSGVSDSLNFTIPDALIHISMVKQKMSLSSELNAPVQLIPLLNLYLFQGQGSILHMGLLFVYQGLRVPERNGSSASRDLADDALIAVTNAQEKIRKSAEDEFRKYEKMKE